MNRYRLEKKKTYIQWLLWISLCVIGLAMPVAAFGEPAETNGTAPALYYQAVAENESSCIYPQMVEGEWYLFLPASCDFKDMVLYFSGEEIQIGANAKYLVVRSGVPFNFHILFTSKPTDGIYSVTVTQNGTSYPLKVMKSENLVSMYLNSVSADQNRAWVEESKSNKAKGNALLLSADGRVIYNGGLKQIKGRGNSTWGAPKKPYQIKLTEPTDLMESGDPLEAETTWVLLTNYLDKSLLHNTITLKLAMETGMAYSPHCRHVDLYYDGEYRGNYLLSEKTEVGTGRVRVPDLEKLIEEANPEVSDLDDLPKVEGVNNLNHPCQYIDGLIMPTDYSSGYLLEMDYEENARKEASWFGTGNGKFLVSKSPEFISKEAIDYLSSLWQHFEDAVDNGGIDPSTGRPFTDFMDLTSLAQVYLIEEFSMDIDSYGSSTYFYIPAGESKFYAGPVWDFDLAYENYYSEKEVKSLFAGNSTFGNKLLQLSAFREEVRRLYMNEFYSLITSVLNNPYASQRGVLSSIVKWAEENRASYGMNGVLWPKNAHEKGYDAAIQALQQCTRERSQALYSIIRKWDEDVEIQQEIIDVPENAWYRDAFEFVYHRGLMTGTTGYLFNPYGRMERSMVVTILYRVSGEPAIVNRANYSDVNRGAWYEDAVSWATESGIVTGYENNRFLPSQYITREEFVTMLFRYAEYVGADTSATSIPGQYTDAWLVSDWAQAPFGWAINQGVINGLTEKTLGPKGIALRCQAAAIFQRYVTKIQER